MVGRMSAPTGGCPTFMATYWCCYGHRGAPPGPPAPRWRAPSTPDDDDAVGEQRRFLGRQRLGVQRLRHPGSQKAVIEIGSRPAAADVLHRCAVQGQGMVEITDGQVTHGRSPGFGSHCTLQA